MNEQLTAANTAFAFELFRKLEAQKSGENIFISPLSVAIALTMVYNGASGETQQAMLETLKFNGLSLEDINAGNLALRGSLQNLDPDVEILIANSLWAKQGFELNEDFIKRGAQYFGAQVTTLDFEDPSAVDVINGWVSDNTKGKINSILEKIDPSEILFLINAIYFNGQWTTEFDESRTQDRAFHLSDGSQMQHPMMFQSGNYSYYEGADFRAISLPYGENERASMYIFLPDKDSSLEALLEDLDSDIWESWLKQFEKKEGTVVVPRFKIEFEANLNDTLKRSGMEIAFEPDADFSAMTDAQVYISQVKHRAVVEVNERGTEAAAVTSVGIAIDSVRLDKFVFIADRPFYFSIRDDETGAVLFMGTLSEPAE